MKRGALYSSAIWVKSSISSGWNSLAFFFFLDGVEVSSYHIIGGACCSRSSSSGGGIIGGACSCSRSLSSTSTSSASAASRIDAVRASSSSPAAAASFLFGEPTTVGIIEPFVRYDADTEDKMCLRMARLQAASFDCFYLPFVFDRSFI